MSMPPQTIIDPAALDAGSNGLQAISAAVGDLQNYMKDHLDALRDVWGDPATDPIAAAIVGQIVPANDFADATFDGITGATDQGSGALTQTKNVIATTDTHNTGIVPIVTE